MITKFAILFNNDPDEDVEVEDDQDTFPTLVGSGTGFTHGVHDEE